jgi:hypothetical protein
MRSIFARRYNDIQTKFRTLNAPCTAQPAGSCNIPALARCVRELAIFEFRTIAKEFLLEAKVLFPNAETFPPINSIAPVELAAARIFDLHLGAPNNAACSNFDSFASSISAACISAAKNTSLSTQIDLSLISSITSTANQVKSLGLGSLNSYLVKLGLPPKSYSALKDHLLLDLRGSGAEYAFNFGIVENILNQDLRNETAVAVCSFNYPSSNTNPSLVDAYNLAVSTFLADATSRTLCTLLKDMGVPTSSLQSNMFRVNALDPSC